MARANYVHQFGEHFAGADLLAWRSEEIVRSPDTFGRIARHVLGILLSDFTIESSLGSLFESLSGSPPFRTLK